jgi:hypothetical protein
VGNVGKREQEVEASCRQTLEAHQTDATNRSSKRVKTQAHKSERCGDALNSRGRAEVRGGVYTIFVNNPDLLRGRRSSTCLIKERQLQDRHSEQGSMNCREIQLGALEGDSVPYGRCVRMIRLVCDARCGEDVYL